MNSETPFLVRVAAILLAGAVPVVIVLTSVRLVFSPALVDLAYRTPGFPEDPYGLSMEDRVRHAKIDLEYLYNDAGPEFLGDLRFEDGTPVYNEREIRHMVDVRRVFQTALRVWVGALAALVVLGLIVWKWGGSAQLKQGLHWGSTATLIAIGTITLALVVGFGVFFVAFHRVFFVGDSWLFSYTDTLIRLFPVQFWQQFFFVLAVLSLAEAALLFWLTRGRIARV